MNPSENNPQSIHTMTISQADKIARDVAEQAAKAAYDDVFHRIYENVYVEIMSGDNQPEHRIYFPAALTGDDQDTASSGEHAGSQPPAMEFPRLEAT